MIRRAASIVREAGPPGWGPVLLGVLTLWGFTPLVLLLLDEASSAEVFLGSDGAFAGDQLQYFSWIRESGEHGIVRNRFDTIPDSPSFAHPMFLVSGVIWRLGGDIGLSFQLWKPVAVAALFLGVAAYTRRLVAPGWPRLAATTIALFYAAPAAGILRWAGGDGRDVSQLAGQAGEMFAAGSLWGYLPTSITLGLMAGWFLGVERLLDPARRAPGRTTRWYIGWTAASGLLVSWLHPWQGETALVVLAAVVVWSGAWRTVPALVLPVLATAAPLLAYVVLSEFDHSWSVAQAQNEDVRPALWVPALALGPLAVPALLAARRRAVDIQERIVRVWPLAAAAVYLVLSPSVPNHAWGGVAIPLAVLATRAFLGWPAPGARAGPARPARAPWLVGATCVALLVVPGAVFLAQEYERAVFSSDAQPHLVTPGEHAALRYLDRVPGSGGVLATPYLGSAVPAFAGRATWVGHPSWTPRYGARARLSDRLFDGRLSRREATGLVESSGVRFLLADCRERADLSLVLGSLVEDQRRFGCATVYEVAAS